MNSKTNSTPYARYASLALLFLVLGALWTFRSYGSRTGTKSADNETSSSENYTSLDSPKLVARNTPRLKVNTSENPIDIGNFADEDFDRAWSEAIASGAIEIDQLLNLTMVVGKMSKSGSPTLVLEKIREEFGPGRSRNMLIGALFMNAPMSETLTNIYQSLEFDDERNAAQSGLAQVIAMSNSPAELKVDDYAFLGKDFGQVIATGLDNYVTRFYSKPNEVRSAAFREAFNATTTPETQSLLISRLASKIPFDCWEATTTQELVIPDSDRETMMSLMLYQDSGQAMAMITSSENSEQYLTSAIHKWLDLDASKPVEWFYEQSKSLTSAQQSKAIQGIVEFSMAHGELDAAGDWARQIPDEALRTTVLASLEKKAESLSRVKERSGSD